MSSATSSAVCIAPSMRLQWEAAQQCHVLLYPEGMVQLNPSAAAILDLCDGTRTLDQIVVALQSRFPQAQELDRDVAEFVDAAKTRGWLRDA